MVRSERERERRGGEKKLNAKAKIASEIRDG